MKNFEQAKKDQIGKLKNELETIEERFMRQINQNIMEGEDYRTSAYQNFQRALGLKMQLQEKNETIEVQKHELLKS